MTNNTTTGNQHCDPRNSKTATVVLTVCYCVLMVAVLVGNILIVLVVYKNKNMRKTVNWFLLNVALSDLLVPFVFVIPEVTTLLTGSMKWQLDGLAGSISCKLVFFLSDVSPSVSTFGIVLISFERFMAVVFPLQVAFIKNKGRLALVLSSWLLAGGLASPYFYTYKLENIRGDTECQHNWEPAFGDHATTEKRYRITLYIIVVVLPLFLLCFFYTCIFISIRRQSSTAGQLDQAQRNQRARENSKVTRTAVAIVGAFAVCFGPAYVFNFIQLFLLNKVKIDYSSCTIAVFFNVAKVLVCLDGALNPLICLIFLEGYRKSLKKLFCRSSVPLRNHSEFRQNGTSSLETNI